MNKLLKNYLGITIFLLGFWSCQPESTPFQVPLPVKTIILDSLAHPWSIAFVNEQEVFISEKDGQLLRGNLESKERFPIKGFPKDLFQPKTIRVANYPPRMYPTSVDGLDISGNAGILDVVLHPLFAKNQLIYVSYVSERDQTFALKVIRAKVQQDSLTEIRTILNPGPYVGGLWHFGGGLCVVDQHLYITVGERLFFEDFHQGLPIAQDVSDARGAIYRLNLDGSIPANNPDFGSDATPGIYAFGIRAAQGITKRPNSDEIWFSEHGTNQGDELNLLKSGANYGWPNITTGTWRSEGYVPGELEDPDYTRPRHYWLQTVAPTGLCFYSGKEFPSWKGNLIVPGLSRGSLWRMVLDGTKVVSAEELFLNDRVRSRKVMQSPEGQLYMLTDEDNGKLILISNNSK
ncbi:MAG: PQQ-dependent sugar dehydrogenase [Bacteroidota bacterium]